MVSMRIPKYIPKFSDAFILISEVFILAFIAALIIITIFYTVQDFGSVTMAGTAEELQFIVNDIFMIIVLVELFRSLVAAYRRRELYLVAVTEVGFIVIIREMVIAALRRAINEIVFLSISAVALSVVLWLLLKKVLT